MAATGASRAAVGLWARSELRRRWRPLVVLGVTAGLVAGLALAALSGARRTSTAYDRYRDATDAPDAVAFATLLGIVDMDYSPIRRLPEVLDSGTFVLAPVAVKEYPMGALPPGDDHLYRTVARPLLVAGRLPDPDRPDEVVVNRRAAETYGLDVGDPLTLVSGTDIEATGPPSGGPEQRATVVGIGDGPMELIFFGEEPAFTPSAAFLAQNPEIPRAPNLVVRLKPGTDVGEFHRRASAAVGVEELPLRDVAEDRKRITQATDLERTGLLLFAAAVVLAGLVMVGQALSRTVYAMAEPLPTLRAMGFTQPDLVSGLIVPVLVVAATGAVVAVAGGFGLSALFPVGLARSIDPDLGAAADAPVLVLGAAALVVVLVGGGLVSAWRSTGERAARARPPAFRRGWLRTIVRSAPLPVSIGASFALDAGRRDRPLPVRPALAGAVAGVLGVVGALGLTRGIDDAVDRPERAGQTWDALVDVERGARDRISALLTDHPDVADVAFVLRVPLDVHGDAVPVYALEPVAGDLSFVVLDGRAPNGPEELAIAPATAKALDIDVGDTVEVGGAAGRPFRVVGTVLVPQTPHSSYDQGAWATPSAVAALAGDTGAEEEPYVQAIVTARPGRSPAALVDSLAETLGREVPGVSVEPPSPPQDVLLLRNVRGLPKGFAAFLVVLGVAALGHALVTAVRRRGHELAVLRALGFRPVQSAACILWQAVTVAVVGLGLGIPLGVIVGFRSWQWVADATPVLYAPPLAAAAVVIAVPAAVVLANLLAALPARRAARLRPAEVLRTE